MQRHFLAGMPSFRHVSLCLFAVVIWAPLVLLRQKRVSSGVNFRDTLKKRCVEGTGHERGPTGTVWRLCRGAGRSDWARGSNGAVAGLLPGLAAAGRP